MTTHNFLVEFSLKWPEKVEVSISAIFENYTWGKTPNTNIKVYPKEQIFKMTPFFPIDLDKMMSKNPK